MERKNINVSVYFKDGAKMKINNAEPVNFGRNTIKIFHTQGETILVARNINALEIESAIE